MCLNVNNLFLPLIYVFLFLLSLVFLIWQWFPVLDWMIADIVKNLVFLPIQEKMFLVFHIQYKGDCSFLPITFIVLRHYSFSDFCRMGVYHEGVLSFVKYFLYIVIMQLLSWDFFMCYIFKIFRRFVLTYLYKWFACMYVHHIHACWVDSLEMGLQMAVSRCLSFGDQT